MNFEAIKESRAVQAAGAALGTLILAASGNVISFDSAEATGAAVAPSFGGVEVTGIVCTPTQDRGLLFESTGTGTRIVIATDGEGGPEIGRIQLGQGDPGRIRVGEAVVGEDEIVGLKAESQGQIVGTSRATMDCEPEVPVSTSTSTSTSTTSSTTSTTLGGSPNPSIPGGETGKPTQGGSTTSTAPSTTLPASGNNSGGNKGPQAGQDGAPGSTGAEGTKPAVPAKASEGRWLALTGFISGFVGR